MKCMFISLLVVLISCKNDNIRESEIVLKLIDFGSLYKYPNDKREKFIINMKKNNSVLIKNSDYDYFNDLNKNNLLFCPYVYIKNNKDENKYSLLFLNEKQFLKVKYLSNEYLKNNKIVIIKYKFSMRGKYFFSDSIIGIKEFRGTSKVFK